MNGREAEHTLPKTVARGLVAEDECHVVLPGAERTARNRIGLSRQHAVNVDATTVDRIIGGYDVLQCRLQHLIVVWRRQLRVAI